MELCAHKVFHVIQISSSEIKLFYYNTPSEIPHQAVGNQAKKTIRSANKSVEEKWMMFEHTVRFPNRRGAALLGVYCKRDNWELLFV